MKRGKDNENIMRRLQIKLRVPVNLHLLTGKFLIFVLARSSERKNGTHIRKFLYPPISWDCILYRTEE